MTLAFLITMAIALVATYIRYHCQEEIVAIFATIIGVISLVTGFVLAPWIVQILILLIGLGGMRYFCDRHSCQDAVKTIMPDTNRDEF